MSLKTTTMNTLSSAPHFDALPPEMLVEIESHLKMHPLEKKVNEYVSKHYPNNTQQYHKTRIIKDINAEIEKFKNNQQTKDDTADAIDDMIGVGDTRMGGKKRTKRTNKKKRTNRKKHSIRRRK